MPFTGVAASLVTNIDPLKEMVEGSYFKRFVFIDSGQSVLPDHMMSWHHVPS